MKGQAMRKIVSGIFAALSWVVVVAVVAQFFFAGLGLFGASDLQAHRTTGSLLIPASLVLLLLALVGRLGIRRIGLSGLLFVLTIVQSLLVRGPSLVAALHPVNALAILGVSVALARLGFPAALLSRSARTRPETATPPFSSGRVR
jgi:hypothetical protein